MADKQKLKMSEKERQLIEKIEQAKNELKSLRDKRKLELGELAYKHGLADLDNAILTKLFASISKDHGKKMDVAETNQSAAYATA